MGYTTTLREEQLKQIQPTIDRMETLKGGESIALRDTSAGIDQLRYLLYSYLYQTGIKPYFVLRRESPTQLRVLRKITAAPRIVEDSARSKAAEFAIDNLLDIEDENEALQYTRKIIKEPTLVVEILEEWRRLKGQV